MMISLDAIKFHLPEAAQLEHTDEKTMVWELASGDVIALYLFPIPPDIAAPLDDIDGLRNFYRSIATAANLGIIEIDMLLASGQGVVKTIFKVPQTPSGMLYLGTLTIPFRDFSYVIKCQYAETGVTGIRDSCVLQQMLANHELAFNEQGEMPGWMRDPYDEKIQSPVMMNCAEEAKYDREFPDHPLSRVRVVLDEILASLRFDADMSQYPPYVYSPVTVTKEKPPRKWCQFFSYS